MESVYTHAQVEALQVPRLSMQTLHLADQPLPLCWLDTGPRPEVADLAEWHQREGSLTFTTQWVARLSEARVCCWLVVEVERPSVRFTLAFPLPASFADLVDIAISRSLLLLFGDCPAWLQAAGSRSELVEVARLQPLLEASLPLGLDANGCDHLARYLLAWWGSHRESEPRR